MSQFSVGESVVCVDASDIPPPWKPLNTGEVYTIRSIEPIPADDGNYDKNIHKKAKYLVRLWGICNPIHEPIGTNKGCFGKELGYAETRFEKIQDISLKKEVRETLQMAA